MRQVQERYTKAISKQLARRNREGRDHFTANEKKAIEWYGKAVQQLEALCTR